MADAIQVSGPIIADGLIMTMETGRLANLAAGAVLVTVGKTSGQIRELARPRDNMRASRILPETSVVTACGGE